MNKYVEAALAGYDIARQELEKYVRENTDFTVAINDGGYPLVITLSPSEDAMQESLFEPDANGEIGEIVITCSSTGVGVDLGLKCHMQAEILKKLLGKCAIVAEASLHAYKAGKSEAAYE